MGITTAIQSPKAMDFLQIAAVLDEQAARIIEVTDSHISIDPVDLYSPELYVQAQIIGNAISHFQLSPHPLGTENDLKQLIPVPTCITEKIEKA